MKQKLEAHYPASSDIVIKMMTDRQFYTDRLDRQGVKEYEVVDHKFDGKDFSITIKRKIAPVSVTSVESWNVANRTGHIKVELQGMPMEVSCNTSLRNNGQGCVLDYDWEIESKIPLVGGKIEKTFAAENEKAIPEQTQLGISLLDRYR